MRMHRFVRLGGAVVALLGSATSRSLAQDTATETSGETVPPAPAEKTPAPESTPAKTAEAPATPDTESEEGAKPEAPADTEDEAADDEGAASPDSALFGDHSTIGGDLNDPTADSFAGMSLADLMQIDVVTATKSAVSLDEAPAIISVVTKEDIRLWGYESVQEALRHTIGFYVVDDHMVADAAVRGVSGGLFSQSGLIKVMINGQSISFKTDAANWLGPELIPLSAVERIEIVRGPSSALYGADAFLGVVNIITRPGRKLDGGQISAGMRTFDHQQAWRDLDLAVGGESGKLEVLLAGRAHSEDRSRLALPASSPLPLFPAYRQKLESRHATGEMASLYGSLRYRFNDDASLSLIGYQSQFTRGWEYGPWLQFPYGLDSEGRPHETRIAEQQSKLGLVFDLSLSDTSSVSAKVYYSTGGPQSADHVDVGSGIFGIRRDFGSKSIDAAVDGNFTVAQHLDLVASLDGTLDRVRVPSPIPILKVSVDGLQPGSQLNREGVGEKQLSNVGALAQLRWSKLAPLVTLTGGARLDYHSIFGAVPSGRLAAVSKPLDALTLKLLYGNAFKAPSPLLLFAVPLNVGDIVGNPNLEPQRVHSLEFQSTYYPLGFLGLSSGATYSKILDVAEFVQQGVNQTARNLASLDTISWESEAKLSYTEHLGLTTSYEMVFGRRNSGTDGYQAQLVGEEQVVYPHHIVRAGVWGMVPSLPLRGIVEGYWAGSRRASANHTLLNGAPYELAPYVLADVGLSTVDLKFLKNRETTFSIKLRNVLDSTAADSGVAGSDYPLLPRSLAATLIQEL